MRPKVLFEDNHFLIVDKPAGWLVQEDKTGDRTLTDWGKSYIKEKYDKPGAVFLHPCHRLDRPVSGIVILARTSKGLERMNKLFREDTIKKEYLAIVKKGGYPVSDKLVHHLKKDGKKNFVHAYESSKNGTKEAELSYESLGADKSHRLLHITPKTGRPHQIRVQLAKIGAVIQGDLRYGYGTANPDKSISLHAFRITFEHPVRNEKVVVTSLPGWQNFKPQIHELDR